MKVLWISNCSIVNTNCKGSGSWLFGMKDIICKHVELYNLTEGVVKSVEYHEDDDVKEYIIPISKLNKNGIPSNETIISIQTVINKVSPDIIHIWGLEKYWAKLYSMGYIKGNVLLEIQGLMSSCSNVFYGGLTPLEISHTHRLKELIKPSVKLENQYTFYCKKAKEELQLINNFKHISTQSDWTRNQITLSVNPECEIYDTLRPIRREFYEAESWKVNPKRKLSIFTSIGYNVPFKGLHTLLKAFNLVLHKYSDAKLIIAGVNPNGSIIKDNGYDRLIKDFISKNNIADNIEFPGKLDAKGIVEHLQQVAIYVNPTFVESYSAATAEALYLGVPSVLSYAGALPCFMGNESKQIASFYSPMDFVDCGAKICQLFENKEQQTLYSNNSKSVLSEKCEVSKVANIQLAIYNKVLNY